jgi:hypothetical protein
MSQPLRLTGTNDIAALANQYPSFQIYIPYGGTVSLRDSRFKTLSMRRLSGVFRSVTPKTPTTKLYDRTNDELTLDEIERILI